MDAVAKPQYVYHGTRPPLIHKIVKEGLRSDSGFSNFGGQGGISVTTDLKAARQFGNAVIALDPKKLKRAGYTLEPFQHSTAVNESELRVTSKTTPTMIPSSLFEKVISYWRPNKFETKWWEDNLPKLKLEVSGAMPRTDAIALTNAAMQSVAGLELPFKVGDTILFGKYKNKKGKILSFGTNHKGQTTVTIEPIPKGRKHDKEIGLFKIWTMPNVEATAAAKWYHGSKKPIENLSKQQAWKAFDGKTVPRPLWLTQDRSFAKLNAGHQGIVYEVEFKPRKTFPDKDLATYGKYHTLTDEGEKIYAEILSGRIPLAKDEVEAEQVVFAIDRNDYDVMETTAVINWAKKNGYDSIWVRGDGPRNIAVLDPRKVKLRSTVTAAKDPYAAFMAEFTAGTVPNFVDRNSRIYNDEVWLEVSPWKADKSVRLSFMMVLDKPRAGHGSDALKWLTGLADKHGVALSLTAQPKGEFKFPKAKLKGLYKKFGFVSTRGDNMRREPGDKKKIKATLVGAKRTASRSVVYHGTSNSVLKSILSKGLVPGKSKTWESDKDTGIQTPSRVSYGGVYFSENFMTALSSSRKAQKILGGTAPVLIEAVVQPRSALPDEDDFHGAVVQAMGDAFKGRIVTHEWSIMTNYMMMHQGQDRNARDGFSKGFHKWLGSKKAWPKKHNRPKMLEALLDDMYEAALTRLAAHVQDSDWERIKREDPSLAQPKVADGERMYREALNAITKTFRRVAIPSENSFSHTFRMMEPVTYSGRNKITAVIELLDYNSRDYNKPSRIKVHKGNPARLLKEYVKAVGPEYELV